MAAPISYFLVFAVAFSTWLFVSGHPYSSPKMDTYAIYTGPDFTTDINTLRLEARLMLRFKVRACSEAHIILMDSTDFSTSKKKTDVLLGGGGNMVSSIRKLGDKDPETETQSEGVLHCSEFRDFWVSWNRTGSSIMVGRGPTPGFQNLMNVTRSDSDMHSIAAATVSTGSSYAGVWEVEDSDLLSSLSIKTTSDLSYTHLWRTVENRPRFLAFTVHAEDPCKDISVGLGEELGDASYEVTFGFASYNMSIKVDDGSIHTETVNQTIMELYCKYAGAVWVDWDYNTIRAGTGLFPGQNQLIAKFLGEGMGEVNAVGFASEGTAMWDFHPDADEYFIFYTEVSDTNVTFNNWLDTPVVQSVPFFVQACSVVHLALAKSTDDSKPILIEIGNDGSTGYVSVDGVRKDGLQGHENLHCDVARPFRIKWHEKKITISRGTTFQDIIFDQVVGSLQSNAYWFLGFGDGNNETATWMLHVQMGDDDVTMSTVEPSDVNRYHNSVPMLRDWYRSFRLRAAAEAAVYLTEGPILYTAKAPIALRLGTNGMMNQSTVEWETNTKIVCEHKDDVISDVLPVDIVLSWRTGFFTYAAGSPEYDPSNQPNCTPKNKKVSVPFMVEALAVSSNGSNPAEWQFEVERNDELSFTSYDDDHAKTWRWFKLKPLPDTGLLAKFRFKGLSGLEILLTPKYLDDADANSVRIELASDIKWTYHGTETTSGNATGILQADRLVEYWLKIQNTNELTIGHGAPTKGSELGKQTLDKKFTPFDAMAFRLPTGTEIRTEVFEGTETQFTTADMTTYNQVWKEVRNRESMVFSIKGCVHSEIIISPIAFHYETTQIPDYLKIKILENDAQIMRGSNPVMTIEQQDLMRCGEEWNAFWMTWGTDGEIALGTGNDSSVGHLLNWYNLDPYVIQAFSFTNGYSQETADWRIKLTAGSKFDDTDWINERHETKKSGLSGGEIAGIVIGVLILVALIAFIAYAVVRGVPEPLRDGASAVSGFCAGLCTPSTGTTSRLEEESAPADNP